MNSFNSLAVALEGWFDTQLCDLPDTLRQRVDDEFWPMPWDRLRAEERRSVALQLDFSNDPAMEQVRQFWWDHSDRQISILAKLAEWESIPTLSAGDLALKEARLTELKRELVRIGAEVFVPTIESFTEDQLALISIANVKNKHDIGTVEWRSEVATIAANALHDKPGGSRDKRRQIQDIWTTAKYATKDVCAEQECAQLNMSFSSARRALRNIP